jgi:tRNA C32,U32 (ribose-2'-O)-methylase TrmJ
MNFTQTLDKLIDGWCERRAIRPLQRLLPAYPAPLFHTDQKHQLLEAMRDVKGLCRANLTEDELRMLIELINTLEDSLHGAVA